MISKITHLLGKTRSAKSRRWGVNILFSTADQGLFSGANFLAAILLAKSVSPEDYGSYSVGFAIYLLFTSFYTSLMLEPVSVLGWNLSSALGTVRYLGRLSLVHLALTAPLVAGVVVSSFFAGQLRAVLLAMGLALQFSLLIWAIRRVAYIYTRPVAACFCSAAYCAALLGSVQLLRSRQQLTASLFFICMAFAGCVAAIPGFAASIRNGRPSPLGRVPQVSVWREHWKFGKWLVLSSMMIAISTQAQFLLSAAFLDLKSAGVLRAMMNFALPPLQVIQAVSILTLSPLAKKFDSGDYRGFLQFGHIITAGLTAGTLVFEAILIVFRNALSSVAYGSKFSGYSGLIPVFGLLAVLQALGSYALVMRAMRRPQATLYIAGASLICVLVLTAPMTKVWGVFGTAASTVISYAASAVASMVLAFRYGKRLKAEQPLEHWMPAALSHPE